MVPTPTIPPSLTWTIPELDAVISDHMTDEMQEAIEFQLALIEDLVNGKIEAYKALQEAQKQPKNWRRTRHETQR